MLCASGARGPVSSMMDAIGLALAPGGYYVLVSHGPPKDRLAWVAHTQRGWQVRLDAMRHPFVSASTADCRCQVELWTLPKPGVDAGGEEARPARYSAERDGDGGGLHFVYVFKRPAEGEVDAAAQTGLSWLALGS
jgi:hypothetical protein